MAPVVAFQKSPQMAEVFNVLKSVTDGNAVSADNDALFE
jgi:hypothetical protein